MRPSHPLWYPKWGCVKSALKSLAESLSGGLDDRGPLPHVSVPFHHHPPVPRELVEFPSHGPGSVKAQALQAEVDKMLEKGALEVVDLPGPEYDSCPFLVQVTGERVSFHPWNQQLSSLMLIKLLLLTHLTYPRVFLAYSVSCPIVLLLISGLKSF